MRIWSLHPAHLDHAGLVACWRETLLAQVVLAGETKGYRNHPQLARFRDTSDALGAIGAYLDGIAMEATARGYNFNAGKIRERGFDERLPVTEGQLEYEWRHLGEKLERRSPEYAERWRASTPTAHPLFTVVPGAIESWERI
ncbi:pyrimidine dimer DNA glycosylase/endonuclease V [Gulosibacter molinativorax]|uniref:DNA lyase n=1 Tax=Gulosibacter molinativorax TaxID=256821 RepID=A0ABT7CBE1_9MICO|nr:pyrimidine dimer DNA glycosylase/endonuclease V [Gulosibacter molinativorax]MDJ1372450.1 DNA lyase [Gulosibacter molinativorax]QUY63503.1 Pyrimidine dimer DNA glycosylase [Gulosibacter molinativorax]